MHVQPKEQADIHVTREKALADYLAMGASRSLTKLRQHYTNDGLKPPSISTLKGWSSAGGWQLKAAEYVFSLTRWVAMISRTSCDRMRSNQRSAHVLIHPM